MFQRAFTWLGFLVLLLLAGLLFVEWQDTLVHEIALIEVDNQSGVALTGINARWGGGEETWPGVKDGQSALMPVVVEKPGDVTLVLVPRGDTVMRRVEAGQRFYVRIAPENINVNVSDDPSLAGGGPEAQP